MIGDWMGTIKQGGAESRLIVHIRQTGDGSLEGTLDNLDVGRMAIPLTVDMFENSTLRFHAWSIDGTYEGTIRRRDQRIDGTWRMGEDASPLVLRRVQRSEVDGIWAGTLTFQSFRLRLVFYIANSPGGLIATMKSCDQNDAMVAISPVKLVGRAIVLEAGAIGARYEGGLDATFSTIEGTWTQGGTDLPLTLNLVAEEEPLPVRPQEPSAPYPYGEEEVRYRNQRADLELAGTLTIPEGEGRFPAVLLIAGSGDLDRDESMSGHRPFLVLADYLTRRGIAVLRADKRGVGESGGEQASATTTDFAMDAEAGVAYLEGHRAVDRNKIGLVGHSEGGLVACMLAARNPDLAFVILLAAPGVPGWELAEQQARRRAEIHGGSAENAVEAGRENAEVAALLRDEKDEATLRRKLEQKFSHLDEARRAEMIRYLTLPWQREMVRMNPADYLSRVKCPVLALNGERDVTVECQSNLRAIRQALESGGNRHFEAREQPGLNHLFQSCTTGAETEYWQIEETLSPLALEQMAEWIHRCALQSLTAPGNAPTRPSSPTPPSSE